jgi:cysteine sulfinate desulfinase/cysteine desulfurase-like protein
MSTDFSTLQRRGFLTCRAVTIIGTAKEKAGVISFVLDGCCSEDVGAALDREGTAVRAGHHCAQPILRRFGLETTVRPSLALDNTPEDIDALVAALHRTEELSRAITAGTAVMPGREPGIEGMVYEHFQAKSLASRKCDKGKI